MLKIWVLIAGRMPLRGNLSTGLTAPRTPAISANHTSTLPPLLGAIRQVVWGPYRAAAVTPFRSKPKVLVYEARAGVQGSCSPVP